jgi:hypothetical protein
MRELHTCQPCLTRLFRLPRSTITANGDERLRTCFPQYSNSTSGVLRTNVVVSFSSKALLASARVHSDGLSGSFIAIPEFLELGWFPPGYESGVAIMTISMHVPGRCSFSHTRAVGFPTGEQGWGEVGVPQEDWGLLSDTTIGDDVMLVMATDGPGANTHLLPPPALPATRLWCAVCDYPCGMTRGPTHVCPANGTRGGGRGGCGCLLPSVSARAVGARARVEPLILPLVYASLPYTMRTLVAALAPLASPDAGVRGSAALAAIGVTAWMAAQAACARARMYARKRARRAAAAVQMQLATERKGAAELLARPGFASVTEQTKPAGAWAVARQAPPPCRPAPRVEGGHDVHR